MAAALADGLRVGLGGATLATGFTCATSTVLADGVLAGGTLAEGAEGAEGADEADGADGARAADALAGVVLVGEALPGIAFATGVLGVARDVLAVGRTAVVTAGVAPDFAGAFADDFLAGVAGAGLDATSA